jgi:hypothetical protein
MDIKQVDPNLMKALDVKGEVQADHSIANGGGTGKEFPANLLNPGT